MSLPILNVPKAQDPFSDYSEKGKLTREFVDYVLNLVNTNKSKAYSIFMKIKKSKLGIEGSWYCEIEEAIQEAYEQEHGTFNEHYFRYK